MAGYKKLRDAFQGFVAGSALSIVLDVLIATLVVLVPVWRLGSVGLRTIGPSRHEEEF